MTSSWVALPNLASGYTVLEQDMDDLRTNIEHLGGLGIGNSTLANISDGTIFAGIGFSAYEDGSNQSISMATVTDITWNKEEFDSNSAFDGTVFTVPTGGGGRYLVSYKFATSGVSYGGSEYVELVVNSGSGFTRRDVVIFGSGLQYTAVTSLQLAAGDTMKLRVFFPPSVGTLVKLNRVGAFQAMKVGL